jgi:hypothetical protein
MAIIANVTFSKKVPAESQFSSQGYSLSLQCEIPESDPAAIRDRLSQTFALVKSQVEHELANGNGKQTGPADPGANSVPMPPSRSGTKASNKQIKFLTDLATQRGISLADLNADIRKRFGVDGLYDLDRKQASALLDEMNGKRKAA